MSPFRMHRLWTPKRMWKISSAHPVFERRHQRRWLHGLATGGIWGGIEGRVFLFWGDAQGTFQGGDHPAGSRWSPLCSQCGSRPGWFDGSNDSHRSATSGAPAFHPASRWRLRTQRVDQAGAGYGYNGFELVDWNQDERVDLLMVNGNNMEIRNAPIKNYHGIRILQQTQERTFEEALFYPFPGAIKALATDFDQDGDLDVAAIAFYPDWSQEHPLTFVYLEQKEGTLTASTTALKDWGRWMTMDAGDFNQDGYPDLILGGAYVKHGVHDLHQAHYRSSHPSILILDNIGAR